MLPNCALLGGFESLHRFRCCENTVPNAKCQRVLIFALIWVVSLRVHTTR